ncbi:hypothetical protein [uncultured Hydrogenophaga sp.]|uniref:hypothetical protein n=1 Tax=uncultured Hydrogenophaga sp. TaxID=199683 RepID=UPI00265EDA1E|nr:hypothetical protein [uncultured Hydrogenophaga sp.]
MFEPGAHQAAGLEGSALCGSALLMPLASSARPAQSYDWLCEVAACLSAAGHVVAVLDATAPEQAGVHATGQGRELPLGLLRALVDPSVVQLERPLDDADWLVMPAALGLERLLDTARAGGSRAALSRLLAPFAADVVVLLFAPAAALGELLCDTGAHAMVPVIGPAQTGLDTYAAAKLLQFAGLQPVLCPLHQGLPDDSAAHTTRTVIDCARRHLNTEWPVWTADSWNTRIPVVAQAAQASTAPHALTGSRADVRPTGRFLWS